VNVARRPPAPSPQRPLSLLLVEGPTDRIFYRRVRSVCLAGALRISVDHLRGLFNVNKKILHRLTVRDPHTPVRAYCCLDRESRYGKTPGFDLDFIRGELRNRQTRHVLSVEAIIATQMIESWFFHDLAGIYRYLRVPRSKRSRTAYSPPERYGKIDLQGLFRRYEREYVEGNRSRAFIESLDVEEIATRCQELKTGVSLIERRAEDDTNHLFGGPC